MLFFICVCVPDVCSSILLCITLHSDKSKQINKKKSKKGENNNKSISCMWFVFKTSHILLSGQCTGLDSLKLDFSMTTCVFMFFLFFLNISQGNITNIHVNKKEYGDILGGLWK